MAENEEIRIILSAETSDAESALKRTSGVAEGLGNSSEKASGGFRVLGFASAKLAEELGVPFRAAHILGTRVEDLAKSSFPALGMAFGAAGLAAVALTAGIHYLNEKKEKLREETIKTGEAAGQWIVTMLKEKAHTEELTRAVQNYTEWQFKAREAEARRAIPAMVDEIKKLTEEFNRAQYRADMPGDDTGHSALFLILYGKQDARNRTAGDLKLKIGDVVTNLGKLRAEIDLFTPANKRLILDSINEALILQNKLLAQSIQGLKAYQDAAIAAHEKNYGKAADNIKLWNSGLDSLRQKSANVEIGIANDERTERLRNLDLTRDVLRRRTEYTEQAAIRDAQIERMRWQVAEGSLQNFASAAKLMSEQGGSNARKYFTMYKLAAEAQAAVSTYKAAIEAYSAMASIPIVGPALGVAAAAAAVAFGLAQVNAIRNQEMGGSAAAVGTYSANPATGLPGISSGATASPNIIININGRETGRVELASDVLRTIYNNNGSVDGFSVEVSRSA